MAVDQASVSSTLIELADTLVSDFELLDYLDVLLRRSADVVGATAGGVLLTNRRGSLKLLASTDEHARLMDLYELQREQGPSLECFERGERVIEEDLAASDRWPRFTPLAIQSGYRSAFVFPLQLREQTIGALNLFREEPGPADPDQILAAQTFGHMAAIGIIHERKVRETRELAGQLQAALNTRVVIEQAKGIVAERANIDVGEAFQWLRDHARDHNLNLRGVAADIVDGTLSADQLGGGR